MRVVVLWMLLVGYFEGLTAQRAIAWKCADSLSGRTFLGLEMTATAPDHSSLTRIRQRLPLDVHGPVFRWVLEVAQSKGVLRGKVAGHRRDDAGSQRGDEVDGGRVRGEKWLAYLRRLAAAEGDGRSQRRGPAALRPPAQGQEGPQR